MNNFALSYEQIKERETLRKTLKESKETLNNQEVQRLEELEEIKTVLEAYKDLYYITNSGDITTDEAILKAGEIVYNAKYIDSNEISDIIHKDLIDSKEIEDKIEERTKDGWVGVASLVAHLVIFNDDYYKVDGYGNITNLNREDILIKLEEIADFLQEQ